MQLVNQDALSSQPMKKTCADSQLILQCALQNKSALKQLYKAHSIKVYHIALYRLKNKKLAEKVVRETFIEIWRIANQFNPAKERPIKWMTKITRRTAKHTQKTHNFRLINPSKNYDIIGFSPVAFSMW